MYDIQKTFEKITARCCGIKKYPSKVITVYHGKKHWSPKSSILAPAIEYMMARANEEDKAYHYAEGLLEKLTDFSNLTVLSEVMIHAQSSGYSSPFISTSLSRDVARSFATQDGRPGYILTIQGPEGYFYDFNGFRDLFNIPQPSPFEWLKEFGIPFQIIPPFELVRVDRISKIKEESKRVFSKAKRK